MDHMDLGWADIDCLSPLDSVCQAVKRNEVKSTFIIHCDIGAAV